MTTKKPIPKKPKVKETSYKKIPEKKVKSNGGVAFINGKRYQIKEIKHE